MILMRRRAGGFTLIEMMVAVTILSILLAIGIPTMRGWLTSTRATAASEFYAEGLRMARAEALKRNLVSRLVLTTNAGNSQQDWQIDICVDGAALCGPGTGTWSTTTTALTNKGATDFTSVFRSAKNLPPSGQMTVARVPADATAVYFTPVGWVDSRVEANLNQIIVGPAADNTGTFPTTAVYLTGGGSVIKCNPATTETSATTGTISAGDSRKCPT
jgi:type IV fimbrial biogenesis protein FimT